MATMNLFIDWEDEGDDAEWQTTINLPLDRFRFDDKYAEYVSEYILRGLMYLAKEVEIIGIQRCEAGAHPLDGGNHRTVDS